MAKIHDSYGGKYKCENEAIHEVKTETFASHLGRTVTTVRKLCTKHKHRLVSRFNYKIKHCGKQCKMTIKTN